MPTLGSVIIDKYWSKSSFCLWNFTLRNVGSASSFCSILMASLEAQFIASFFERCSVWFIVDGMNSLDSVSGNLCLLATNKIAKWVLQKTVILAAIGIERWQVNLALTPQIGIYYMHVRGRRWLCLRYDDDVQIENEVVIGCDQGCEWFVKHSSSYKQRTNDLTKHISSGRGLVSTMFRIA